jgi:hypothetical protein
MEGQLCLSALGESTTSRARVAGLERAGPSKKMAIGPCWPSTVVRPVALCDRHRNTSTCAKSLKARGFGKVWSCVRSAQPRFREAGLRVELRAGRSDAAAALLCGAARGSGEVASTRCARRSWQSIAARTDQLHFDGARRQRELGGAHFPRGIPPLVIASYDRPKPGGGR